MLTNKIEAQDFAVRVLKGHLKEDRISHAYIFSGDEHSGKEELALAFGAALNCLEKKYFQECECNSCHKIAGKNHPDIHIVGEDEDARSIKIETIRESIAAAALKPYEGKYKVFIFKDAPRLTIDASNAILKTLEEAPAHTIFILLAEAKANLLETIQSRAFEIRLKPLAFQETKIPLGFASEIKNKAWEEILEEGGVTRDAVQKNLEILITFFRERLPGASGQAQEAYLEALDLLIESKDALESNTNPKLVASRLAMQLRLALPQK